MHCTQRKMNLNDKTNVLIEALPYISKYNKKLVVIKAGGNALSKQDEIIEDIVLLKLLGMKPIVVHGGGPEIDKEMEKSGIKPIFIDGLRYTDEKVIKSVVKAFSKINKEIVKKVKSHGAKAINLKNSLKAEKLTILTNVDGVVIGGKLQSHVDFKAALREIKRGIISKGMIPKVNACIYSVRKK